MNGVTVSQAAQNTGVSRHKIYRWVMSGQLPATQVRIGAHMLHTYVSITDVKRVAAEVDAVSGVPAGYIRIGDARNKFRTSYNRLYTLIRRGTVHALSGKVDGQPTRFLRVTDLEALSAKVLKPRIGRGTRPAPLPVPDDDAPAPVVLYGLLTENDVRELERRRSLIA